MYQPEPQSRSFSALMNDIETGRVKIPQFQRDFVWTKEKSAQLIDSIIKGFPIGTFILWQTKEELRSVRNLGDVVLPPTPSGEYTQHVLDGQQRLTSLFAAVKGLKVKRDERIDDFSKIFVRLNARKGEHIVTADYEGMSEDDVIPVATLVSAGLSDLSRYPQEYHHLLDRYKQRFTSYAFSVVMVNHAPLDIATEIFTRINVTGKPLTVFEIMVAKTFDRPREFDLAEKYGALKDKLTQVSYETLPSATVLQTVAAIMKGECGKRDILRLHKDQFINVWPRAETAIFSAVDYFRAQFRIPVSRLLPYAALVVPFAYFFYHHKNNPTGETQRQMANLFWRVSLGGYYSHSLETRLAQDIKRVNEILSGKPAHYDYPVDISCDFITENGWFNAGRSFIKAILCVLAYHHPRSFDTDNLVTISNDWLRRANSKNYHHFFPKAYLKSKNYNEWEINHIVNITIVDEFLNKSVIKAKPPSVYMTPFKNDNGNLESTMETHLIKVITDRLWDNDYRLFFKNRCKRLSEELEQRIIPQARDSSGQAIRTDDFDESSITEDD